VSLVTITAGIGSEAYPVAREAAERLSIDLYDDERLREEFLAMGLSSGDLESLNEKAPGFFRRLLDLRPNAYQELMESVVCHVARRGEGFIIGYGSAFLLQDFGCALHVRIYSSESRRVERIMREWNVDESAAAKAIRRSDNERRGFMEYAFNIGWHDLSLFDLVVNVDKLGHESAASVIVDVASSEIINACSLTALETMQRFSLEKRVEAVVKKTILVPKNVQVSVTGEGEVTLMGIMNPLESKDKLIEAVKAVPGVHKVVSRIATEKIHDI